MITKIINLYKYLYYKIYNITNRNNTYLYNKTLEDYTLKNGVNIEITKYYNDDKFIKNERFKKNYINDIILFII